MRSGRAPNPRSLAPDAAAIMEAESHGSRQSWKPTIMEAGDHEGRRRRGRCMTATDTPDDGTAASQRMATDGAAVDEEIILRIANVPRDVGWLMISVGVIGVILPGIIGTPFLVAGIAVLAPGGPQLLTDWVRRNPKAATLVGLKQMGRWLDDLERRYPRPNSCGTPCIGARTWPTSGNDARTRPPGT
jgi:hypothetical protein